MPTGYLTDLILDCLTSYVFILEKRRKKCFLKKEKVLP
nr:MAG TPA: hypothetical protein [Caudoviricetes sp.]